MRPKAAAGGGWRDVAGLRAGSRGEPSRISTPGFIGARTGRAVSEGVHPEAGWAAAAARGRRLEDKIVQRAVVEVLNAIYGKRRTTGMEKGMKESYIEDLANHDGPEPCVGDP